MSINIKNVSLIFDNIKILENINLLINSGEILSIIGPNGAGKSSLLEVISGDLLPSKGKVFYEDRCLTKFSLEEKARKRSVMSQFSKIAFDFKVKEVIEFGWIEESVEIFSHIFNKLINKVSKLCEIDHLLNRNINSLSGGELKRVQLAKTLVQLYNPSQNREYKYALLDEPLANLDPFYEIKFLKIITDLSKKQGIGVLLIIHDINLAAKFSDKIVLMNHGKIIDYGSPFKVLKPSLLKSIYKLPIKKQSKPFRIFYF